MILRAQLVFSFQKLRHRAPHCAVRLCVIQLIHQHHHSWRNGQPLSSNNIDVDRCSCYCPNVRTRYNIRHVSSPPLNKLNRILVTYLTN